MIFILIFNIIVNYFTLFGSVVEVDFQNVFRAKMHQNNIYFLFFKKIIFKISASKRFKIHKNLIFNKNK
jgi:hypothetical protein